MGWWWLQDKTKSNPFKIYWDKGTNNKADYQTKHFGTSYHQHVRLTYIHKGFNLSKQMNYVGGCVEYPPRESLQQTSTKYTLPGASNQQSTLAHLTAHIYPLVGAHPYGMTRKVPLGVNK